MIKYVGKLIKSKYGDIPFAIAGSYASAVVAVERDPFMLDFSWLTFNDIDVYIKHQGPAPDKSQWSRVDRNYEDGAIPNVVEITYEKNVIPRSNIEVNLISLEASCFDGEDEHVSLEGLVEGFDINAVMVGFVVAWSMVEEKYRIVEWYTSNHFDRFLVSRKLKIPELGGLARPASAFVRLLRKAQQLNLDYKLPEESLLLDTLDGRYMGEPTVEKLETLGRKYKREFTNRFLIADSFFSKKFQSRLYKLRRI